MSNLRTVAALFKMELEDMFNNWEASKPLRVGAPHASAILAPKADWCLRRHVLAAVYPEAAERPETKPWDAHTNAVFLHGWHIHEKYQKLFSDHAQVVEVETSHFDETRFLHFTPDAIILWGGQPYVVEIKGYKTENFDKMDESEPAPQAAHHQCNFYCHLLNIEHGLVLVENKNTQDYKVWAIERDVTLARPYTDRCYAVKGGVLKAQTGRGLPIRTCASCADRQAQKCSMRNLCFSKKLEG